jgi:hypothetical protein
MLSTLQMLCSQRTTRKFHYGVLSNGFSKGQEVRANVEHPFQPGPFVVGRLRGSVGLGSRRW